MSCDYLIIANPVSGRQTAPAAASRVRQLLEAAGAKVDLQLTTGKGDAFHRAIAAVKNGVKIVAGCGGDGTLHEIAAAIENSPTALGIIPHGRCNDFARALGFPKSAAPEQFAKILLEGRRRKVDLGAVGKKRFLTVATLGFDSDASRFVETRRLWVKGTPAYLWAVLAVLWRFRSPTVLLRGDFGAWEGRILLTATGNTSSYGGAMKITPNAKLDDGIFHVTLVEAVSKLTVLRVLPRVIKGTHLSHPRVRVLTTSWLEITTPEGPQWICADGESLCQTPCRLEIHPNALEIVAPS
jgi:diacylglycerol kinase (ATP)